MDSKNTFKKNEKTQNKVNDSITKDKEAFSINHAIFNTLHYFITLVFAIFILYFTIELTIAILDMNVSSSDTYATTAKNLMISAVVISYFFYLCIAIGLVVAYNYSYFSPKTVKYVDDNIKSFTFADSSYVGLRILVFSCLMFVSIIMAILAYAAAYEISLSENSADYTYQYNVDRELARDFTLHAIIFALIQLIVWGYEYSCEGMSGYKAQSLFGFIKR